MGHGEQGTSVAVLMVVGQRPPTTRGFVFITMEGEDVRKAWWSNPTFISDATWCWGLISSDPEGDRPEAREILNVLADGAVRSNGLRQDEGKRV